VRGEGTGCNENVLFHVLLQGAVQSKRELTATVMPRMLSPVSRGIAM